MRKNQYLIGAHFNSTNQGLGNQGIGNSVNVEGRGTTGRVTPNNLNEKMAMEQVKSNPLNTKCITINNSEESY